MHIPLGLLFLIFCSLHHIHSNGITLFPDHPRRLSLPFVIIILINFIYKNFYEVQQAPVQQISSTLSKMLKLTPNTLFWGLKKMVAHEACIHQSSRLAKIILAIGNILHILKDSEWNCLYSSLLKALHSSFVFHFLSDILKSLYWKARNKNKNRKLPVLSCECEK